MFVKVLASVQKVEKKTQFPYKPEDEYVETDLKIMPNDLKISGILSIREPGLQIGQIYAVVIDTRSQAIKSATDVNEVGEAMLQAATEVSHG